MAASSSSASGSTQAVAQAVEAYASGAFDSPDLPKSVSESLSSHSINLLSLIRTLGPHLTSEDDRIRARAVELLSQVVLDHAQDPKLFDRQSVLTLADFFSSKLEDGTTTATAIAQSTNAATPMVPGSAPRHRFKGIPDGSEMLAAALRALDRLAKTPNFGSESAKKVTKSLISHVVPRDHPQALRFLVFRLLDTILARQRPAVKALGDDFLKGYINLVEGEKDPRNLMYIFAMDRVVLLEWEIPEKHVEEFFDITYCYFPITFRPPPDDPYGITTEELKDALKRCLIANPLLAPQAMPLLIEKLQASGGSAKRDALEVVEEGLPVFGKAAAESNAKQLWEILRLEIIHANDDETSICAQRCLESLLRVLYEGMTATPEGVAQIIVADCLEILEEPEKQLAKPATSIMACLVQACAATAYLGVHGVLDQMLTYFKDPGDIAVRAPILGHIATILQTCKRVYQDIPPAREVPKLDLGGPKKGTWQLKSGLNEGPQTEAVLDAASEMATDDKEKTSSSSAKKRTYDGDVRPLDPFRDELLSALSNGIQTSAYRATALEASVALAQIPSLLSRTEINFLAEGVNELLLLPGADDVRMLAMDGLRELAAVSPKVLEDTTLPLLFSKLPDRIPAERAASEEDTAMDGSATTGEGDAKGQVRRSLAALARICAQPVLFEQLVVKLLTKLDLASAPSYPTREEREGNVGYARGILNTLRAVLEDKLEKGHKDVARYGASLPPRLVSLTVLAALRTSTEAEATTPPVFADVNVVRDAGYLSTLLVQTLEGGKQAETAAWLFPAFETNELKTLSTNAPALKALLSSGTAPAFEPLASEASAAQRNAVFMLSSIYVALRKDLPTPRGGDALTWVEELLRFTASAQNELQEEAGCAMLSSTFNKSLSDPLPVKAKEALQAFWSTEIAGSSGASAHGKLGRRRRNAIRAWFGIVKGLTTRASKVGEEMMDQAIQTLFLDEVVGKEAARGIGLVARADDAVLSKENGAVLRLLYRQRFFATLVPKLLNGYREAAADGGATARQTVYLITLAYLLPSMPRQTTREKLPEIFPLLLRALELPDARARASAASTIDLAAAVGKKERSEALLKKGDVNKAEAKAKGPLELVEDHINTIIDRMLVNARPGEHSSTAVRSAALRCLATLSRTVPYKSLHPYRVKVQRALSDKGVGIDDPKRSVRIQGVEARDAWLSMRGEE